MTSITYGVVQEIYEWHEDRRISYGIVAYADLEDEGSACIVASIRDISSDKTAIETLVQKCNRLQLSLVHLGDVVQDFMVE